MSRDKLSLDGKPAWKIILRGAAIPGMIVAAFAFIGFLSSFGIDATPIEGAKFGAGVGLFFSLWGGLETMTSIFFLDKNKRLTSLLVLGYAIVWAVSIYFIFYGRS